MASFGKEGHTRQSPLFFITKTFLLCFLDLCRVGNRSLEDGLFGKKHQKACLKVHQTSAP